MANSFFEKLNVLVRSQINDLVSFERDNDERSRRDVFSRREVQQGLEGDVKTLRQRVDEALAYQDELQARADKLYGEIADWDAKADRAVDDGREQDARFALGRLQQAQREVEMVEADLREHRYLTQDLITQVNQLEAVVDQSKREQANDAPVVDDDSGEHLGRSLMNRMDETRRQLSDLIAKRTEDATRDDVIVDEVPQPRPEPKKEADVPPAPKPPVDQKKVDDDLSSRLARLSKPPKNPDQD